MISRELKEKWFSLTSNNDDSNIPRELPYSLSSGANKTIPVSVTKDVEIPSVAIGSGDIVANQNFPAFQGTLSCPVKSSKGKIYLLTCAHVLNNGHYDPDLSGRFSRSKPVNLLPGQDYLGKWFYGFQSSYYDIALIRPDKVFLSSIVKSGLLSTSEILDVDDINRNLTMNGGRSGHMKGQLLGVEVEQDINFTNKKVKMKGLLKIGQKITSSLSRTISQGGDSGSVVYDENDRPLGIVIGGNSKYTFALPQTYSKGLSAEYLPFHPLKKMNTEAVDWLLVPQLTG